MAWARKMPSGRYQACYRGPDGKVRTEPGGPYVHKAEATRRAADAEAASRSAGWRDPEAARATWGKWCAEWFPTRNVEASTKRNDESRRDVHLLPRWESVALADITRHDVKAWAAALRTNEGGTPRSAATVQRIIHLFSASLAAAVDAEILNANPATRLRLGGGTSSAERFLTRDEFDAVLAHLEGPTATMARLLAGTGMRWGEAAGLHWARVDAVHGIIEVSDTWSLVGRSMKAYPKGRRRRHVPIPDWLDLGDAKGGTCGYTHDQGTCRSALVVTTSRGAVMDESQFYKAWKAACAAADVGHVRIHDLRHSYASWLLQAGVPLAEVGRLLGHVSPLTTQRYAHLADVPKAAVLAALNTPERAANVQQPDVKTGFTRLTVIKGGRAG